MSSKKPSIYPEIVEIIKSNGLEYSPSVVKYIQTFVYNYSTTLLKDAEDLSKLRNPNDGITKEDVVLAIKFKNHDLDTLNPDFIRACAEMKNSSPVKIRKNNYGLKLPIDENCLLSTNYQMELKNAVTPVINLQLPPGPELRIFAKPGPLGGFKRPPENYVRLRPTTGAHNSPFAHYNKKN